MDIRKCSTCGEEVKGVYIIDFKSKATLCIPCWDLLNEQKEQRHGDETV